MIVTIDGPAGAGKSSIARRAADRLGFAFLDTGAFYRAVTLAALRRGIDLNDPAAVESVAAACRLDLTPDGMMLDGENVADEIRTPRVTASIVHIADVPPVRKILNQAQRQFAQRQFPKRHNAEDHNAEHHSAEGQIARRRGVITEGRDQGTEVFPDASCKVFLTASPDERARRRYDQLCSQGVQTTIDEIRAAQDRRDAQDAARPVGALRPADDAIELLTDGMTPDQVIDRVIEIIRGCPDYRG